MTYVHLVLRGRALNVVGLLDAGHLQGFDLLPHERSKWTDAQGGLIGHTAALRYLEDPAHERHLAAIHRFLDQHDVARHRPLMHSNCATCGPAWSLA